MKKLALSLVLTLGVSGMALANNGNGEKEKQPVKKENTKKKPKDCLVVDVYVSQGICSGERTYTKGGSRILTDCGETEGGVLFQLQPTTFIDDCNWDEILSQ